VEESQENEKVKPLQKSDQQTQTALKADESQEEAITVSHETKSHQTTSIKNEHNDIKKTFNTFAQEFKEKVESYKPPLMKIKMQLSPEKLGDVDITLINRGNNLHVNINSSPSTIALFAQNQTEFKNSLVNMGFTGLQMNFGENRDNQRGQQHKNENKQSRPDTEEANEIDGFEMTVPQYI
jgi:deoxyribodipyrimidine photolyase